MNRVFPWNAEFDTYLVTTGGKYCFPEELTPLSLSKREGKWKKLCYVMLCYVIQKHKKQAAAAAKKKANAPKSCNSVNVEPIFFKATEEK